MTRQELVEEIRQLTNRAADSGFLFTAASLSATAAALNNDAEQEFSKYCVDFCKEKIHQALSALLISRN